MIHRTVIMNDWTCEFYFAMGSYRRKEILGQLVSCHAPGSILRRVSRNMRADKLNTGFTFSNCDIRKSVIVIGNSSSGSEFLNSFVHELRHLTDDIARADGMQLSGEPVAYLSGDIATELSDIVCRLSCDSCRKSRAEDLSAAVLGRNR